MPASFVVKLWTAAAVGAATGWGIRLLLPTRNAFIVAALVLIPYGLVYFAVTFLFGLPELSQLLSRLTRLLAARRPPAR